MIDACKFDGKDCPNRPTFFFVWAWGEEGVCCDDHRANLETRSKQLERQITFSSLGRGPTSKLRQGADFIARELPADESLLQKKLGEEMEQRKRLEQQIARLEKERETNVGKMREQELRIQDLLKRNEALGVELAEATELATAVQNRVNEVIEGGTEKTPATHGKGSKSGK